MVFRRVLFRSSVQSPGMPADARLSQARRCVSIARAVLVVDRWPEFLPRHDPSHVERLRGDGPVETQPTMRQGRIMQVDRVVDIAVRWLARGRPEAPQNGRASWGDKEGQ